MSCSTVMLPFRWTVNAQVTVSPAGDRSMFEGGEPSEHVVGSWCQPGTAASAIEYPLPAGTSVKVRWLVSVFSSLPSSSSWNEDGDRPPPP